MSVNSLSTGNTVVIPGNCNAIGEVSQTAGRVAELRMLMHSWVAFASHIMKSRVTWLHVALIAALWTLPATAQPAVEASQFVAGRVLVQFAEGTIPTGFKTGSAIFDVLADVHGIYAIEPALPSVSCPAGSELARIYRVHYGGRVTPAQLAASLESDPTVVFAEPEVMHTLHGMRRPTVPNDPSFSYQSRYMDRLKLPEAWDVVRGDQGDVVIGIVDSGVDWQHEDLRANVWTNPGEVPDNGLDDDGNGFVDDVHGFDFAQDKGYTSGQEVDKRGFNHGTASASMAAATADNGIGLAGSSWNAKFISIGASCDETGEFVCHASMGFLYAAMNGAKIINASFGTSVYSRTSNMVVRCATEMGALVIASAGNEGINNDVTPGYPANFPEVLSVGGTFVERDRNVFNFGATVDVYAAARDVSVALVDNTYARWSGTSFSSPLTAGIAALVLIHNPSFSPGQLREQIRRTAESIEGANPASFEGLLGLGRVNAFRAVTGKVESAVRIRVPRLEASADTLGPGVTGTLVVPLQNYFSRSDGITVEVLNAPSYVDFETSTSFIDAVPAESMTDILFPFTVTSDAPYRKTAELGFRLTDDDRVEQVHLDLTVAQAATAIIGSRQNSKGLWYSVTTEGNIGFLDRREPPITGAESTPGFGILFRNYPFSSEAGLVLATGPDQVLSSVAGYRPIRRGYQPTSFRPKPGHRPRVNLADPNGIGRSSITLVDTNAPNPIGVEILEETEVNITDRSPDGQYAVLKYTITNTNAEAIRNLHVGLYSDWDIAIPNYRDAPAYNEDIEVMYQYVPQPTSNKEEYIVGFKHLSPGVRSHHGAFDIWGGYPGSWEEIMWWFMSRGNRADWRYTSNWGQMVGAGPFDIEPDGQIEVGFAMIVGSTLENFLAHADEAQVYWDSGPPPPVVQPPAKVQIVNAAVGVPLAVFFGENLALDWTELDGTTPYISHDAGETGLTVLHQDGNNDPVVEERFNLEPAGNYQVLLYGDNSRVQATLACCSMLQASHPGMISIRFGHAVVGIGDLSFRLVDNDDEQALDVGLRYGEVSDYTDILSQEYTIVIAEGDRHHSNIPLDLSIAQGLSIFLVVTGSKADATVMKVYADGDAHTFVINPAVPAKVQIINAAVGVPLAVFLDENLALDWTELDGTTPYISHDAGETGLTVVHQDGNNDPIIEERFNLEPAGNYQVLLYGDDSHVQTTLACCSVLQASNPGMTSLRFGHAVVGLGDLRFRLVDNDDEQALDVGLRYGEVSDYTDILSQEYTIVIAEGDQHNSNTSLDLSNSEGSSIFLVVTGSEAGATLMKVYADGEAVTSVINTDTDGDKLSKMGLPEEFIVLPNFPNPFWSTTRVYVDLPTPANVSLDVYDLLGRLVLQTPQEELTEGFGRFVLVEGGDRLGSGTYLYRVTAVSETQTWTGTGKFVSVQ